MIDRKYFEQVELLLQLLPHVAKEKCFALKGGTAINLFIRELPRLSVDIDLAFLPFDKRDVALQNISDALQRIKESIEKIIPDIRITMPSQVQGQDVKLLCNTRFASVKIEVNTTMRGQILPARLMQISNSVQNKFGKFAAMQVVSNAELFGGKICAALDRQHPRDLFDVFFLLDNEGFTDEVKIGLIASLLSHPRPINEVIKPTFKDQEDNFKNHFEGMTELYFSYEDYLQTRERLIQVISKNLTNTDKAFLISFKEGDPDWSLSPILSIKDLPAIQWKLLNIQKLIKTDSEKHKTQLTVLKDVLEI